MEEKIEQLLSNLNLIPEDGNLDEGDAFASLTLNPTLRWMRFILTDDIPNDNRMRVPESEFINLVKTGIHMPIKMASGGVEPNHDNAHPLGVITNLKQVQNRIEGLAALWSKERPEDVDYVIKEFQAGKTPQISWEIPFTEVKETEDGIKELYGICLRAATLVGLPAYAGRTPVLAVASKEAGQEMEDTSSMDELETLKTQLKEATDKITDLEAQLADRTQGLASVETELTELREFKANAEKEQAEAEKLVAIRAKFAEAGIEKGEEYFTENKQMLLALDDTALDFMVQELVSFAKASLDTTKKVEIPNVTAESSTKAGIQEIAKALRERKVK